MSRPKKSLSREVSRDDHQMDVSVELAAVISLLTHYSLRSVLMMINNIVLCLDPIAPTDRDSALLKNRTNRMHVFRTIICKLSSHWDERECKMVILLLSHSCTIPVGTVCSMCSMCAPLITRLPTQQMSRVMGSLFAFTAEQWCLRLVTDIARHHLPSLVGTAGCLRSTSDLFNYNFKSYCPKG